MKLAMEEVLATGQYDHRQILRPCPVEHHGERHRVVLLAVNYQRPRLHMGQLKAIYRDADEHQPLRLDALREHHLHARAEGETRERKPGRPEVLDDRGEVFELAAAFVVAAFGLTDAAEVGTPGLVAQLDEGARQRLHHLVVERAAVKRVRMRDERDADGASVGGIDGALDAADRSGDELAAGAGPHILRRSTMRPCCRCSSMISSMSARSR